MAPLALKGSAVVLQQPLGSLGQFVCLAVAKHSMIRHPSSVLSLSIVVVISAYTFILKGAIPGSNSGHEPCKCHNPEDHMRTSNLACLFLLITASAVVNDSDHFRGGCDVLLRDRRVPRVINGTFEIFLNFSERIWSL